MYIRQYTELPSAAVSAIHSFGYEHGLKGWEPEELLEQYPAENRTVIQFKVGKTREKPWNYIREQTL